MSQSHALSHQFDDAAQLYDEVRPHYPEAIRVRSLAASAA
jgi:hypothetical protein